MLKKVEFNFMEYNHKIYELHKKSCKICQDFYNGKNELSYCVICGKHDYCLNFCYWCGDVVCWKCCPIPLESHNWIFEAKEEV